MNNELYHYGIQGMRWGIRRFQNSDGTRISKEERKSKINQYKKDKKEAFENGKNATIYAHALNKSMKKTFKSEKKLKKAYEKDPNGVEKSTKKKYDKVVDNYKTQDIINNAYDKAREKGENHCKELIKRYGRENVKPINYKNYNNEKMGDYKLMNERVISGKDWCSSAVKTLAISAALSPAGFGYIEVPASGKMRGNSVYRSTKRYVKTSRKNRIKI